jgi:hypothetical protein
MLGMSARWQQPPASPVGWVDQMLMGEIAMEIARVTKWPAQRRPFGNSPVLRQSLSGGMFSARVPTTLIFLSNLVQLPLLVIILMSAFRPVSKTIRINQPGAARARPNVKV